MTPQDLKNNDNTTQLNKITSALKSLKWRYPNWTLLSLLHWNVRARIGATCWTRLAVLLAKEFNQMKLRILELCSASHALQDTTF